MFLVNVPKIAFVNMFVKCFLSKKLFLSTVGFPFNFLNSCDIIIAVIGMRYLYLFLFLLGCAPTLYVMSGFVFTPIDTGDYTIVTFQRLSDNISPLHIYIEGDGNAFDVHGQPTMDPTPHGTLVRDLAMRDTSPNVIYMARPCQYVISASCSSGDWTTGRFSSEIIDSMSNAIKQVAGNQPVVLIGYSGGAMISGLVINKYPEINVREWITIAGVLNHADWTSYFEDMPLHDSVNMNELPRVPQRHYIARGDSVVPNILSRKWVGAGDLVTVDGATHGNFPNLTLF